jgi:hypothetical protein
VVLPPLSRFAHAAAVAPAADGVVAVGIYHQTRQRDLEEHTAQIHRSGATSIGAAFARRTLIPRRLTGAVTEPIVVSVPPLSGVDAEAEAGSKRSGPPNSLGEHRNSENGDSPTQALDLTLR